MSSTRLGYLMVKREATTAVAVKPTHAIRFKDGDIALKKEVIANNPIQNNRWNALNAVPGKITTEGTYNLDLDANEAVHWLSVGLGALASTDVSSATDGSVFQHVMTVANSLPSLTVEQGKGNLTDTTNNRQNYMVDRAFGVLVDSFTMSASDGIVNLAVAVKAHGVFQKSSLINDAAAGSSVSLYLDSAEGLTTDDTVNIHDATPQSETDAVASVNLNTKIISIATLGNSYTVANDAKVELVPQTPSYGTPAKVFSFVHASWRFDDDVSSAASSAEENVEDWEIEYSNNLEERFGSLRASPSVIAPKGAKMMIKFTKYFTDTTDRDRYLNIKKQGGVLSLTNNEIISATDTNNVKYGLDVEMSDVRFTSYEVPTGTDELYAVNVEGEVFHDSTDGRAVRFVVTNAKAGTEYTA